MSKRDFLPYRQVHLDFHTSEAIPGIGADFDPDEFADTLVKAHVNSITVFARCHHGWIYYPSTKHPERVHPHLETNLVKEQIEACHKRGIRCPIYTTVQWDHYTARSNPEWLLTDENGMIQGTPPYEAGFYRWMNVNSAYVDFLKEHVAEMVELFEVDGFFFDIVQPRPSADRYTQDKMRVAGMDPACTSDRQTFALSSVNEFKQEMSAYVRSLNPEGSIFYNAGHVGTRHRAVADAYSHWELETLPSGGWGYQHFPVTMRYSRNVGGIDVLAQTGKFHTSWGDFHSFKNLAALQYECFRIIAMGAKCMIGDQLPPRGKIEQHVYELIGQVYAEVEEKEPWCHGATAISEIAVVTPEEWQGARATQLPGAIKGVTRMLEEGSHQFDIVDSQSDLSGYKVVVLPDQIPADEELAEKLDEYVEKGGSLIATFESGLSPDKEAFALASLGVTKISDGPTNLNGELVRGKHYGSGDYLNYILANENIRGNMPPTEHAMYIRGLDVQADPDSEVMAAMVEPYFDRTWAHFCSHRQTPSSGKLGGDAIVRTNDVIYFANPIFSQYHQNAPLWCKTLFLQALDLLLPQPLVRHQGPSTIFTTLNEQAAENRWILHLLHYIPERRGVDFDVIEDVIPLYNVDVEVRVPNAAKGVSLAPSGEEIAFRQEEGVIQLTIPAIHGHQMVVLQF